MTELKELRRKTDRLLLERATVVEAVRTEREALALAKGKLGDAAQAQTILQDVAEAVQTKAHHQISAVVTKCLAAVFGDEAYTFAIRFVKARGKTDARLVFIRNGKELNPLTESGGGCVDIACIALRLVCLVLTRPKLRRVLVLDEPLRGLSPSYQPLVPELLTTLAKEMGVQFIVATNMPEIRCGKVIDLEQE